MKLWESQQIKFEKLSDVLMDPVQIAAVRGLAPGKKGVVATGDGPDIPVQIKDWLGRLKMLYGVPFNYLVPDERMLPKESIRFFYVDSVWLDYLAEGALSIGRSTSSDLAHDQVFGRFIHRHANIAARQLRKKMVLRTTRVGAGSTPAPGEIITPTEKVTGFLLRSDVVKGWPGLEIQAYKDSPPKTPLGEPLRLEHLSENVLLCFFEGVIKELHIHEHAQDLHFGVDPSAKPPITYSKSLRYLDKTGGHEPGEQIDASIAPPIDIESRFRDKDTRVLRIDDLARAIQAELKNKVAYTGNFTAAEFALELVEGVEQVVFTFDK